MCWLFVVVRCLLFLLVALCLVFGVWCSVFGVRCLAFGVWCSVFGVRFLLVGDWCSMCVACRSLWSWVAFVICVVLIVVWFFLFVACVRCWRFVVCFFYVVWGCWLLCVERGLLFVCGRFVCFARLLFVVCV